MNVLVLGGGAREHALVKALKLSPSIKHVSCAQGNPGIAQDATCHLTDPTDGRRVLELAQRIKPDVTVIGPEAPLAAGVSDILRQYDFNVFGPSQAAARLETSKVFSKEFMKRHGIPSARAVICTNKEEMLAAKNQFQSPWVVKADGLASGKGVRICNSANEFEACARDFFDKKVLGDATKRVLVEEFIRGEELSLMAIVAGDKYSLLPVAQDHKRLHDKDKGPNTGGMGAFAPVAAWTKALKKIEQKIVAPTLNGLKKENLDYRGVLYFGLMMKKDDPHLLEYNVRFGDPEAQVVLPLLSGDWAQVFVDVGRGQIPKLNWKKTSAISIVLAAAGYPENPIKGAKILIDRDIVKTSATQYILHGATASYSGYYTNGGRVLNVVAIDKSLKAARKKAYDMIKGIEFEGMQYRKDIAASAKG